MLISISIINIMIMHLIQTFPGKLLRHNYPDPEKPGRRLGRSEIERREEYFKMLEDSLPQGNKHLLFILSKECLNDDPSSRPTAENLFIALQEMKATIECPYGIAVARIDAVKEVLMVRALGEGYYAEKNVVSIKKDEEIKQLQQELIETQASSLIWHSITTIMYSNTCIVYLSHYGEQERYY